MSKTYIVTFDRTKDSRPAKFVVLADNQREAIRIASEEGGADFQVTYERGSGLAQEMKRGALRVL